LASDLGSEHLEFDDNLRSESPLRELVSLAFDASVEEIVDRDYGTGEVWQAVIERFSIYALTRPARRAPRFVEDMEDAEDDRPSKLGDGLDQTVSPAQESEPRRPGTEPGIRWFVYAWGVVVVGLIWAASQHFIGSSTVPPIQRPMSTAENKQYCQMIRLTIAISQQPPDPRQTSALNRC
jgi:hypothetical protein